MATITLNKDNFESTVSADGIVLVDFWASWCGPCRTFSPIYESASEEHRDVVFGKIDTEDQPELAGAFQIRSIPTLMVFRDRVLLFQQPGALPAATLQDIISQAKALDMEEVKKKIAEQDAADATASQSKLN